ncbi:hypothetical protein BDK51DRAFT_30697, partial [Blyttiomyces helicus]
MAQVETDQIVAEEELIEEDEIEDFMEIERLQDAGINAADITKMKAQGVTTVRGVQMMTVRNLSKIKGMSEAKIEKIKEAANKLLPSGFITGTELECKRKNVVRISTG